MKSSAILPDFLLIFVLYYMLVTFCNIVLMPLFSLLSIIYLYSYSPHPLYNHIGMLFPTVVCCCFYAYLPDVDLMLFITYKTSSIKIWFVLVAGLAENLSQVVFCQPFAIQHVRT